MKLSINDLIEYERIKTIVFQKARAAALAKFVSKNCDDYSIEDITFHNGNVHILIEMLEHIEIYGEDEIWRESIVIPIEEFLSK